MTHVFRLIADTERFDVVRTVGKESRTRLAALDGHPVRSSWSPQEVELVPVGQRGDFFGLSWSVPVVSERAWDTLRVDLEGDAEPLELQCPEQELIALNVFRADALDIQRSDLVEFPDGGIMKVRRYAFHDDVVRERLMFKIPASPGEVLVTGPFVELVESHALRGAVFIPLPRAS